MKNYEYNTPCRGNLDFELFCSNAQYVLIVKGQFGLFPHSQRVFHRLNME
jgi:hypothetical protein